MGLGGRLAILGEAEYRRLFWGRTASLIGDGIAPVALAFAVLDLTGSAADLGLVLAANSFVILALVLVGGVYADRISPRRAMVAADLLRVFSVGAIAALLIAGVAEIWQLAVLWGIEGAGRAFFNPASDAIVPQVVPAPRIQEARALLNLSRSAGKVAGPALAGLLLALGTPGWALAVDAATFAVSAAFIVGLRPPPLRAEPVANFLAELRHGWHEFSSRTWLWVIVISAAFTNALFFPAFQVLGPAVADTSLGGSSAWALIAACFGAGAVLGGLVALVIRPRRPLLVGEGVILLLALPALLLAGPAPLALIAIGTLLTGAALSVAEILYETVAAQLIDQDSMSRVMAYDWFGSLALEPIGLALIGPIAAGIGTSTTLWIAAGTMLAAQAAVLLVPSVRRLELPVGDGPEEWPTTATLRPVEPGE